MKVVARLGRRIDPAGLNVRIAPVVSLFGDLVFPVAVIIVGWAAVVESTLSDVAAGASRCIVARDDCNSSTI